MGMAIAAMEVITERERLDMVAMEGVMEVMVGVMEEVMVEVITERERLDMVA